MSTAKTGKRRAKAEPPLTDEQRRLAEDHVGLVAEVARRFAAGAIPAEDRRQDGMLGLIEAVREFDPTRGVAFEAFARRRIEFAIIDAERAGAGVLIRIPRSRWARMTGDERRRSQPRVRLRWRRPSTADAKWSREDDTIDPAAPREEAPYDAEMIRLGVDRLGGRTSEAVRLYYWHGLPMKEIGRRLDLCESRVSQVLAEAVERMREQTFARRAVAS